MPKYTKIIPSAVQLIIIKSLIRINAVGRSSLVVTLVAAVIFTSLWTNTTQAEAPDPVASGPQVQQVLVDGLTVQERAAKIDAYFVSQNMPLAGNGLAMVTAADAHKIDWTLLAAISVIESTGGQHACKKATFNAFGWNSCKTSFKSYDEAIETISAHLGGDMPTTARHYDGKNTVGILSSYNQVRSDYKKIVLGTMDRIAAMDAPSVLAMK